MKITIITPSLNQGRYIEKTINSVLTQPGDFELEYLIIDGGSSDNTMEILNKYKDIKWVSEADRGQSHAVNKGFLKATGDIIGWLNSDDLYEAGTIQKVVSMFGQNHECQWLVGKCHIINEEGLKIRKGITNYKNWCLDRYSYERLLFEDFISQPAVWFKRSFLEEVGFLDETLHYTMDYDLWLRMGAKSNPVVINDYLASFRYYPTSKTGSDLEKSLKEVKELCKRHASGRKSILFKNFMYRWKIRLGYRLMSWIGM